MRRLNACSAIRSTRSARYPGTVVVGAFGGITQVISSDSPRTSGSVTTTAKLLSYALTPTGWSAGFGFFGAPPNFAVIAFTTSAGSASATTITVAFEAQYHF